jgi:hypothetical protein
MGVKLHLSGQRETQIAGVGVGAEKNIWTQEGGNGGRMEKAA